MKEKIKIIHIIDSLSIGGSESVAVNIINSLPSQRFEKFLCATRYGGPLSQKLNEDIEYIEIHRKSTFDLKALIKLAIFIKEKNILLIHAHSSSLFISILIKTITRSRKVIWHDHYGLSDDNDRSVIIYRFLLSYVDYVVSVNHKLSEWVTNVIGVNPNKNQVLPNFIIKRDEVAINRLPGEKNSRIICVANFRPQKDHITLIKAMRIICNKLPNSHLILIGKKIDVEYSSYLIQEIDKLKLSKNITCLESVDNVQPYLKQCDVGVLSSKSEGLPLSLLEYGLMSLSVVVTNVGQCAEVVEYGDAGILIEPQNPELLAQGIIFLLENESIRNDFAVKFHNVVIKKYSSQAVIPEILNIYEKVLTQ